MIKYLKRLWDALWARTTLDEKVAAALREARLRLIVAKRELEDVKKAVKNVANQSKDVFDAVKGKKRRGRKPNKKDKKN